MIKWLIETKPKLENRTNNKWYNLALYAEPYPVLLQPLAIFDTRKQARCCIKILRQWNFLIGMPTRIKKIKITYAK